MEGSLQVDSFIFFGSGSSLAIGTNENFGCAVVAPLACFWFDSTDGGSYSFTDLSGTTVTRLRASDGTKKDK